MRDSLDQAISSATDALLSMNAGRIISAAAGLDAAAGCAARDGAAPLQQDVLRAREVAAFARTLLEPLLQGRCPDLAGYNATGELVRAVEGGNPWVTF